MPRVSGFVETGNRLIDAKRKLRGRWTKLFEGEDKLPFSLSMADRLMAHLPLKAMSTAEDVARFALFLASDEARTITGQSMNVDAGDVMVG